MSKRFDKTIGILILICVYLGAFGVGSAIYYFLPLPFWLSLFLADVAATLFTFAFSLIFRNASVYDPYWSVQPVLILASYAVFEKMSVGAFLALVAVTVWGIRLTANWAYTFRGIDSEDWRYTMLREKTGKWYFLVNLLGIHLVPTIVVYLCTLPAVFTFVYAPAFNPGSSVFFSVSLFAVLWQGTADCQMHAFRRRRTGGFLRTGLWRYSRHPNYLGEIVMWWAVGLAAVCLMPSRWWLLAGAVANSALFLFVSIPLADGHQARKEGFEAYRAETRRLLPIPRFRRPKTEPNK